MTALLVFILFPIGLYFYLKVEKKADKKYIEVFDDFYTKTKNSKISKEKKRELFKAMLIKNGYKIEETKDEIVGEKKVISVSLIVMSIGIYYIGLLFYLIYYFLFKKPHIVVFKL